MRKAINRRAVLKTGTALVAATVVGVVQAQAIEATPGDKILAESVAEWIWRWESSEAETDEEIDANCSRCCELERLMIETKADTLAGILAKEKWLEYPNNFSDLYICPHSFPIFQSLMADVKRIGGQHV